MCDPPPLGRGNIRIVLMQDPVVTGAELSEASADLRWQDLPGLPADVRQTHADFHAQESTCARHTYWGYGKPAFTSTRGDALKWMEEEIAHGQCGRDDKHMER